MWMFPSLYARTDPYGPYGTRRIHLRVLASMWPKYTRTPIDRPYSSDRKRGISYGLLTGYRSVQLSKPHLETEGLRHIAPCAEDRCMNYTKNYISIRPELELSSQPTSKLRGEACLVIGLVSNMTASKGKYWPSDPFYLTVLYMHVHVAILAAQFLFFLFF